MCPFRSPGLCCPFWLTIPVVVKAPFPSKVSVPTWANGPARAVGAVMNPAPLCANVPFRVALEHPLSSAFAVGATPRASAVTAAIVKAFCDGAAFHDHLLCIHKLPPFRKEIIRTLFSFRWYRRKRTAKAATFWYIFCATGRTGCPSAHPLLKSQVC